MTGEKILEYMDEIKNDLNELISIRSVSCEGDKLPEKALDYIFGRAEEMGFEVKKTGNIAGHIEYGSGEEIAAVLAHVDVVPAGEGWSVEPFALTEKEVQELALFEGGELSDEQLDYIAGGFQYAGTGFSDLTL